MQCVLSMYIICTTVSAEGIIDKISSVSIKTASTVVQRWGVYVGNAYWYF